MSAWDKYKLMRAVHGERVPTNEEWLVDHRNKLRAAAPDAIETLVAIMRDVGAAPGARVNAANSVLDRAGLLKLEPVPEQDNRPLTDDERAEAIEIAKVLNG
jgi:phage terminase small subunit